MTTPEDSDEVWLSPLAAGSAIGKSDQTVLSWIHRGDLDTTEYRHNGRLYEVRLCAVERVARTKRPPRSMRQPKPARANGDALGGDGDEQDADEVRELLSRQKEMSQLLQDLVDERDRLRVENRRLRETAIDLHSALGRWIGSD